MIGFDGSRPHSSQEASYRATSPNPARTSANRTASAEPSYRHRMSTTTTSGSFRCDESHFVLTSTVRAQTAETGVLYPTSRDWPHDMSRRLQVASEIDRALFEKAIDLTAMALRGSMGGDKSQPPSYAADLFKELWAAVKEGAKDLPERSRPGF